MWKQLVVSIAVSISAVQAPKNLISNPDGSLGSAPWLPDRDARIEGSGSRRCFAVRNGGIFSQEVNLPDGFAGGTAVFVGWGLSERVIPGGAITGLPNIHGVMINTKGPRSLTHLQGQNMLARPTEVNRWVRMWGVFPIPEGTGWIGATLQQGEQKGLPQSGSAARFDDIGLYVFHTEDEARSFLRTWIETSAPPGLCGGTSSPDS